MFLCPGEDPRVLCITFVLVSTEGSAALVLAVGVGLWQLGLVALLLPQAQARADHTEKWLSGQHRFFF